MSFAAIFTSVWAVPRSVLADNLRILTSRTLPVTCDNIVMLSATVLGDPSGHTFEWEQISGEPVIWLESVYQTNVMFQQPATRDDKIFHFVVDKGKSIEKRYEVLVTAIPTDIISTSISAGTLLSSSFTYNASSAVFKALVPAFGLPGSIEVNNPTRAVLFDTPYRIPNSNVIPSVTVLEYVNGEYVPLGSVYYDYSVSLSGVINSLNIDKSYLLKTNGYTHTDYSLPFSFPNERFLQYIDLAITDSDKISLSLKTDDLYTVTSKEVITRQLLTLDIESIVSQIDLMQNSESLSDIVEKISRTLESLEGTDFSDTVSVSMASNSQSNSSIVEVKQFQYSSLG